jgi:hypothetical protein
MFLTLFLAKSNHYNICNSFNADGSAILFPERLQVYTSLASSMTLLTYSIFLLLISKVVKWKLSPSFDKVKLDKKGVTTPGFNTSFSPASAI